MASLITSTVAFAASNGPTRSNFAPHRTNAARRNRSDSPYQQRTTQRDNPTQVLIKQAVDYFMKQLEAGHSETLAAYLGTMARFHNYSFGNILQIARQRPTVRETEAEAVAFIVGQAVGLEMGTASSDYIQLYKGNAALLAESLQVIQRTSAVILGALQMDDEQFISGGACSILKQNKNESIRYVSGSISKRK
jgi:hypothetical protein